MKRIIVVLVMLCSTLAFSQTSQKAPTKSKGSLRAAVTLHQVSLSWTASTSACSGTFGTNIYRGTTAGGESTTALNTALITGTTYVDTTVSATLTYFYTAKAFCSTASPNLSVASNEVTAVIPGDPQPAAPTGLTSTVQ